MEIYKKLLEAKKEIGKISKDSTNPFFKSKYFDINQLLEHSEPILQKNGLLLLQPIEGKFLRSKIFDVETGESVSSEIELDSYSDPQKLGSAITYYRRYTLQSLLGLQSEDDDGNGASGNVRPQVNNDNKQWLNLFEKDKTTHTREAKSVYAKMKTKEFESIDDIRKIYKVSKQVEAVLQNWFVKLKKAS